MADLPTPRRLNRHQQIIERIFFWYYKDGDREVIFERADMERAAQELGIDLPKNLGDIPYTFRYRGTLPESIRSKAPVGKHWIIRGAGRSRYRFALSDQPEIIPNSM